MRVRTAGLTVGLTFAAGLMIVSPSAAGPPPLVTMKLKVVDQDGKPLPDVTFGATSTAGELTHREKFTTNSHGVGRYHAYADSTATLGLNSDGSYRGFSNVYDAAGDMDSATDPNQLYYPSFSVGDAGSTDSLTLPDLVTHRVKLVTQDGKPIMYAQVELAKTLSVPETDTDGNSYRIVSRVQTVTNSGGWVTFKTFQPETDTTTLADWNIQPDGDGVDVGYNTIGSDTSGQDVPYSKYLSQTHYTFVAPYSPHFVHLKARPGKRRGYVVVTAVMRQATGFMANSRVLLQRQPSAARVTSNQYSREHTNKHGLVTFHVTLAHKTRLVLSRDTGSSSPAVIFAEPRP